MSGEEEQGFQQNSQEQQEQKKQQQKQDENDATKKLVTTGAKAAATGAFGPAGGAAVSALSKVPGVDQALGQAGKIVNAAAPGLGKVANLANKTGALDVADKATGAMSGGGTAGAGSTASKATKSGGLTGGGLPSSPLSSKGEGSGTSNEGSDSGFDLIALIMKHKFKILPSVISAFSYLLIIVAVIAAIFSIGDVVANFFNGIVDFFTTDQQEQEQEFYETLKEVQDDIRGDHNVCIDVNLIVAALTINNPIDEMLGESQEFVDDTSSEETANGEGNGSSFDYKQMKKQVKMLANMQLQTNKYELNNDDGDYCSVKEEYIPISSGNKDSSSAQLIAQHDIGGFQAFFTKKSNEEKNYAYFEYHPAYNSLGGTCTYEYAKDKLPDDEKVLSIGDLSTKENAVFYWNLINSFIPDYYNEYLPKNEPERTQRIIEMADEVYLLYKELGPSKNCGISYAGPSSLCPNGVTVKNDDGNSSTYHLEEYVAGVVSAEAYVSEGIEALKAQAVAARTYVLKTTNYCQTYIQNNSNAQNFTKNINDKAREAAFSTAGEILIYNGKIFLSEYDSFCYDDKDCPDAIQNSDGTYSVTYNKQPSGEKHTINLSTPKYYDWMVYPNKGHARGMSQLVSYQLAEEGKSYQEILSYFYSDGVEISTVLTPANTEGATIIQTSIAKILSDNNSSTQAMNQYIFEQVTKAGLSTRQGVVAAANSLITGIYNQTGFKIPYELHPSGKYSGYGIDPNWGTGTGNATYPLNGLDCSGFISWAIHNGGYSYVVKNAQGWGNSGQKRPWFKGTLDKNAQPGDLIFNEPTSANGTSGHIRMIIGVTDDGYVVAEASGKKNGVRINTISFISTGNYYLVNMTGYYQTATKVTDYPQ